MKKTHKERPLYQRIAIDIAGFSLMISSLFLGWLPGPGGIPLFLAGLGLVSLNHEWAENMLKNFDRWRVEFTKKYLMTSPRVSHTIDVVFIAIIICGIYLAATQSSLVIRAIGLMLTTISLVVLLSNQKRFERIVSRFKKHKR